MKSIKYISLVVVLAIVYLASSCFNNPFNDCEDQYYFEKDNVFVFYLHDINTQENLLQIGVNKYHKDTVKIFDGDWNEVFGGPLSNDGRVLFSLIQNEDLGDPNLIFHKEFFLYLNQYDTDTLVFDFTMEYDAKCKEQDMLSMRIVYNDSIYFNSPNNYVLHLNFFKK